MKILIIYVVDFLDASILLNQKECNINHCNHKSES